MPVFHLTWWGGWFIHLQKIYVGKSPRVQVYVPCGGHVPQIPSAVLEVELFGSNSIHGLFEHVSVNLMVLSAYLSTVMKIK